jgi:hypothetical protein
VWSERPLNKGAPQTVAAFEAGGGSRENGEHLDRDNTVPGPKGRGVTTIPKGSRAKRPEARDSSRTWLKR